MTSDRPSSLHLLGASLAGGCFGGSVVGIAEAAWVLSTTTPAEYQAVGYGATLYGAIGAGMGLGVGAAAALAGTRLPVPRWGAWFAGAWGVVTALGVVITRYVVNKSVYAEQGVPAATLLGIVAAFVVAGLVKGWIARMLLTKTPLQALLGVKGATVGWGVLVALAWLFSMAPAPGAKDAMPAAPAGARAGRSDVLVVLVDTLRADALGAYGAGPDASPNLDAFAREAVLFEQHVTSASWTRASTASLFTSMSPTSHACETKDSALPQMVVTLAEALGQGGYRTGGLPNNANVTGAQGFDQGFDWFPYAPQYPLLASESTYALSMYAAVRKAWTRVDTKKRVESYYMPAETQLERASAFLAAGSADSAPAFLFVHLMEPHDPYFEHPWTGVAYGRAEFPNPDPARKDALRALYAGEVAHADAQLGAFFAKLKAEGRYDDTMIVVTSDHGEEFLEHGGWWHGTTLYDEQVRTPLLVKLPKGARAGVRVPWQVRQIDVAPTIAEVAGVEVPATWQGSTLFDDRFDEDLAKLQPPAIDPEDPATATAAAAFVAPTWVNHPASREALSEQDFEGYDLQALRGGGRKLIQALRVPKGNPRDQSPLQAYDLQTDPGEQADLAGTGRDWEGSMKARLEGIVEERREVRVAAEGVAISDAERARLEALGYMQGEDAPKP